MADTDRIEAVALDLGISLGPTTEDDGNREFVVSVIEALDAYDREHPILASASDYAAIEADLRERLAAEAEALPAREPERALGGLPYPGGDIWDDGYEQGKADAARIVRGGA